MIFFYAFTSPNSKSWLRPWFKPPTMLEIIFFFKICKCVGCQLVDNCFYNTLITMYYLNNSIKKMLGIFVSLVANLCNVWEHGYWMNFWKKKKKGHYFLVGIVTKMHGKNDIERNSTKFN